MINIKLKKIILAAFSCFCLSGAFAREYKIENTYELSSGTLKEYRLKNKIPVYMNTDVPNQVNAVYIVVEERTEHPGPEYSGLESSLFEMMTYGSKKYRYEIIQALGYKYQSSIGHYSLYSGSVFTLNCINYYMDEILPVYLDCFINPSFDEKQFALLKQHLLQSITSSKNSPDSILFDTIRKQVYKDSPLLTSTSVKEESFDNITIPNLKKCHEKILDAGKIKVIAVGKFDEQDFISKLDATLGKLKKRTFLAMNDVYKPLNIGSEKVVLTHKDAKGSEMIVRIFESPSVLSDDYVCGQITSDIFSTTLFNIIREKYGACYTPASQIESSYNPIGIDYGSRVSDLENFEKYYEECVRLMLEGKVISSVDGENIIFDSVENVLQGYKNSYITKKYTSQSTSSGIASRIAASILQFSDLTTADKIPEQAMNVTSEDVLRVFKKYWVDGKSQWFYMVGEE